MQSFLTPVIRKGEYLERNGTRPPQFQIGITLRTVLDRDVKYNIVVIYMQMRRMT
jgi:hypothetical protein